LQFAPVRAACGGTNNYYYENILNKVKIGMIPGHGKVFEVSYIVPERKLLIFPISASGLNFNPQNTPCIPAVKICAFLELEKIF